MPFILKGKVPPIPKGQYVAKAPLPGDMSKQKAAIKRMMKKV